MKYTIDLQKLADELDFDLEDVEMLLGVFLDSAESTLKKMREAIEKNDKEGLFHLAHSIKGSALNLRLTDISELAKEIEMRARNDEEYDYQSKYETLQKLIDGIGGGG
jgi:HPt (histidine-containing phosphotransfer) domain-containing protein